MRVLQAFEPVAGGVHVQVRTLTQQLVARGHEVTVAMPGDDEAAAGFSELGARVVVLDLVERMMAPGPNLRASRGFLRIMAGGRFDVAHVHDTKAGALGRLAAAATRTPNVYSAHGFAYRAQRPLQRRAPRAKRMLTLNIERALAPLTGAIVCVSEEERAAALADRVASASRLRLVYYGIEPPPKAAAAGEELASFRGPGPLVGFMARLAPAKGVGVLLDALCELRDAGRLPRIALVGNGPLRDEVARRLDADGLAEQVLLRPFDGDVWPTLAAFDVFVLPSLFEGLPIAALEAMAAGLPVIGTDANGTPEAVVDRETGLIVPAGNATALAAAIDRLATDPALRRQMGEAAERRYRERFRAATMVDRLEALYEEVAGARPSATSSSRRSAAAT